MIPLLHSRKFWRNVLRQRSVIQVQVLAAKLDDECGDPALWAGGYVIAWRRSI
jgi:hypothetical protein